MSVNLLTGLPPSNFGTDYQTWFYNGLFGSGISIFPTSNTPSILALNTTLHQSFSASSAIYLGTINDVAGFAIDINTQGTTTTYTLISIKLIATNAANNQFTVSVSHFDGSILTTYLSATIFASWSGVYDYPSLKLKATRNGSYVAVYANNALVNFGSNSLLGESVNIPTFIAPGSFVLDGFTPYTDTFGFYINGIGGSYPTYDTIIFNNPQIYDLARDASLDYFIQDASSLGGILEYNGEKLFTDNFTTLANWQ